MGNLSKGVRSESRKIGAKWPERNSVAEAQSLKPSPALRSGFWSCGIAKAPRASTGVSFSNSRRLRALNLRGSVGEDIALRRGTRDRSRKIREFGKGYAASGNFIALVGPNLFVSSFSTPGAIEAGRERVP